MPATARASGARMAQVSAAATPSAASAGWGALLSRSSFVTMNCTWVLVAAPVPTTAFLISAGGVLVDCESRIGAGEEDHAARMAEDERGADVARVEHVLHRHRLGPVSRDELAHAVTDVLQSLASGRSALRADHAAFHELVRRARAHHAVAGDGGAGVDAEDQHA
jgi:hypothetical protein